MRDSVNVMGIKRKRGWEGLELRVRVSWASPSCNQGYLRKHMSKADGGMKFEALPKWP